LTPAEPPELLIDAGAGFDAELLDQHPDQEPVLTFAGRDAGLARPEDALELRITPADGPSWIGRFEGGYPSPATLTTVHSGPGAGQLVVINRGAGFLVSAADPSAVVELDVGPIVALLVDAGSECVLAADFTRLAAYTTAGRQWSADVGWDGVELHEVTEGVIRGRVWDAPRDQLVALEVDLATGRVLRGATPHR
jgi:hypothetical protein